MECTTSPIYCVKNSSDHATRRSAVRRSARRFISRQHCFHFLHKRLTFDLELQVHALAASSRETDTENGPIYRSGYRVRLVTAL
jgi:hypothetical protein